MSVEVSVKENMILSKEEEGKYAGYPFKTIKLEQTESHGVINAHEVVPPYIVSEENIIDELTSKETREKMDEAHNKMLEKKFNIYYGRKSDSDQTGIFDDVSRYMTDMVAKRNILTASPLLDDEYREVTTEFINTVLPKVKEEKRRLSDAVTSLEYEKKRAILEYDQKIRQAKKDQKSFEARLKDATINKFQYVETVDGLTDYIDGIHTSKNLVAYFGTSESNLEMILTKCEEIQKRKTEDSPEELERKEILDKTKEAMKKPASFFDRITGRK